MMGSHDTSASDYKCEWPLGNCRNDRMVVTRQFNFVCRIIIPALLLTFPSLIEHDRAETLRVIKKGYHSVFDYI